MKGLIHIYTGNGKGKTTAAVGLGIRACGCGLKVLMVQFLKGSETGEIKILEKLAPGFKVQRTDKIKVFLWNMDKEQKRLAGEEVRMVFKDAVESALSGQFDVLILDEIMASVSCNLIDLHEIVNFLKAKPESLEVIMTGRNAPSELIELSDYVSEINEIKHPFNKGINARKGIEF